MVETSSTDTKFVSVFSDVNTMDYIPSANTNVSYSFLNLKNIIAFFIFIIVVAICILGYIYRDWVFEKTGYYTLQLYLGKPNEIRKTEIPQNSRLRTLYEDFEIIESLQL